MTAPALECTLERNALLKAMSAAQRVVEKRTTIPVLSNVRIEAVQDRLAIKATDLDIQIDVAAEAAVRTPGITTVPAHTFHDIVRKLQDGAQVSLSMAKENTLIVKSGRSRFTLQTLDADQFPDLAVGDLPYAFELAPATIGDLIARTGFAISSEETRYYLNGIYMHPLEGKLVAVATDGHRLARVQADLPSGAAAMPGVIVPRKTVTEIARLLTGQKQPVRIEVSVTKMRVTFPGEPSTPGGEGLPIVLTSKLIDGTFPDYQRVIPQGNSKSFKVETAALSAAVDRVATISNERGRAVKFAFAGDGVTLTVTNPDAGRAEDYAEGAMDGDDVEIGFNGRYFTDVIGAHGGDTTIIKLADAGSPTLFAAEGDDDALFVLMPMRV
ncbi:DNA polymerase III subunit beta [Terrihabitans sp. B22-R8]|uniref:DNA polymerase III subunit beta n=1 Tax=Terrihabitans sp. B22-R8 TaxID=3425128 RepID=UPI00403C7051